MARQRTADVREGLAELGWDDEHGICLAACELGEHLEVLVAEELLVRVAFVDRVEHGRDRFGLAVGAQDRGLARALGLEHG